MPSGLQAKPHFVATTAVWRYGKWPIDFDKILSKIVIDPSKIGIYLYKMVMINDLNGCVKVLEDYQPMPDVQLWLTNRAMLSNWTAGKPLILEGVFFFKRITFFCLLCWKALVMLMSARSFFKAKGTFEDRLTKLRASGEFPSAYTVSTIEKTTDISPGHPELPKKSGLDSHVKLGLGSWAPSAIGSPHWASSTP